MLHHGLTGTEGAGNRRNAALGDGEQCVDDALSGYQRHIRGQLGLVGTPAAHRPLLHEADGMLLAPVVGHHRNRGGHRVLAGADIGDGACNAHGDHDLLLHHVGLLDRTDDVAAGHLVADLGGGHKLPLLVSL